MLSAIGIIDLHDRRTRDWHHYAGQEVDTVAASGEERSDWLSLVSRQHRANFELWHIEDEARTPGASERELAEVKRRVDSTNQRRNDLSEQLDHALLAWLDARSLPRPEAPLHSESPGSPVIRRRSVRSTVWSSCCSKRRRSIRRRD